MIWTLSTFATPFLIRSRILPGVAMTTCTDGWENKHERLQQKTGKGFLRLAILPVSSRRMMSSRRFVPPVVAMTLTPPRCLAIWMEIWLTCRANSRVGTKTSARTKMKKHGEWGDDTNTPASRVGTGIPGLQMHTGRAIVPFSQLSLCLIHCQTLKSQNSSF